MANITVTASARDIANEVAALKVGSSVQITQPAVHPGSSTKDAGRVQFGGMCLRF
jgi:hypothetical protein